MKAEHPCLLPLGFHAFSLSDLRHLCVDRFTGSTTRQPIFDGFSLVVGDLRAIGIEMELWVDGSFLTEEPDPEDCDVVARIAHGAWTGASEEQHRLLAALVRRDLKPRFRCDFYCFVEYEKGHILEAEGEWMRAYWLRQFGFSRSDRPKGLAVIQIAPWSKPATQ
jgi:hypothetical protein